MTGRVGRKKTPEKLADGSSMERSSPFIPRTGEERRCLGTGPPGRRCRAVGIPAEFLRKYACAFHVGNAGEGAWVLAPFRLAALLAHHSLFLPPTADYIYTMAKGASTPKSDLVRL